MCEICDGMTPEQARRAMLHTIDRCGWALQYVESAIDDRGVHPAFCYTVGLTEIDCPEVVLTGRVADQSAVVLNELGHRMWHGDHLEPGERISAGGLDLFLVQVRECESWLLSAVGLYGQGQVSAVQAVWADCQGRLPWEGAISSTIVQPLLGPPPGGRIVA
ncbi:DUF4262 domain-containing protein [Rhodococcus spelaei]|uniref:DUF4262 domain-containing protein n=1 Tax=Rhodococcus spelaei TaxID=2546320 RepID=A0A541B7G2_9NOCA|nr:DUF4262 domain-containing protein [Rhodococcus spelaei]TQF68240.1 DUF4262 domain-containing protein [Rhodococcus spelaei]